MNKKKPGRKDVHIRIVDDDPGISFILESLLAEGGYRVATVENGPAALSSIQEDPPSLIILDYTLPEMNGSEFMKRYRTLPDPLAPVVVCTASPLSNKIVGDVQGHHVLESPTISKPCFLGWKPS